MSVCQRKIRPKFCFSKKQTKNKLKTDTKKCSKKKKEKRERDKYYVVDVIIIARL